MKAFRARVYSARKRAFTLIEILVATVVMIILVGLVIQITVEVLKVWNRSAGKLSANAEARIALDLLTQDLETAVFRNNGKQWIRVEGPLTAADSGGGNGGDYEGQTVALKLFSSPPTPEDNSSINPEENAPGIRAIGYRLAYQEAYDGATERTYALYRNTVNPADTFNNLLGSNSDEQQNELIGAGWNDNDLIAEENYLAGNIVEFKILIYTDDLGVSDLKNANNSTLVLGNDYSYGGGGGDLQPPLYADIFLTIVSDEGLRLLQNIGSVQGTGGNLEKANTVVREHGEVYARRVSFLARPL